MKIFKKVFSALEKNRDHHRVLYIVVFFLATLLLFLPIFFQIKYEQLKGLGLIGLFMINVLGSATIFLPAPAIFSVGISAFEHHPLLTSFIAALGSAIGEGATFLFGFSSSKVLNLKKRRGIFFIANFLIHRWKGLLIPIFAFIPNPFFDGLGILAGISKYPIKRFLFLAFLGRFVRNIAIVYSIVKFF